LVKLVTRKTYQTTSGGPSNLLLNEYEVLSYR